MKRIPDKTWVQIRKPEVSSEEWKDEWRIVGWDSRMDEYNNEIYRIENYNKSSQYYHLEREDLFNWHHDWLVVLKLDKDGAPIPIDNQGRKNCYWCKEKIKTRIIQFKYEEEIKYMYCPKCLR
jgi:hypothetical protein